MFLLYDIFFDVHFFLITELCIIEYFVFYIQLFCTVAYIFLFVYCSVYVITTIGEKEDYEPSSLLLKPRQHDHKSKNKNQKNLIYDFSFDSAHSASFMKFAPLQWRGGLHILPWDSVKK